MMLLLVEAALRSLALGALVWIALLIFRPRNPHLQKTIWVTVLVASIAMPFILQSQITPRFELPDYMVMIVNAADVGDSPLVRAAGGTTSPQFASLAVRTVKVIYLAGALALLARLAIGLAKIARIRRRATPLRVAPSSEQTRDASMDNTCEDIRASSEVLSPATFGSTILLPATATSWSQSKLTAVLAHERAHVRHKDCYVQWLARLYTCVFWFNPLAWWLQRRLADLAETTSDDAVLATSVDRIAYADLLLEIARNPPAGRVVMSAARPGLAARIERIISNIPPASPPRRWLRAIVIAALMPPFAMAAATLQSDSKLAQQATATASPKETNANDAFPEWQSSLSSQLKIVDWGDMGELEAYYPPAAKVAGREGTAVVGLVVNERGVVTEAKLLEATPADEQWGFGPAAEAVTHTLLFANPTGVTVKMKIKVRFDLKK